MKRKTPPAEAVHELKTDSQGYVRCRVCGCTEVDACPVGCCWVEDDLCSVCAAAAEALGHWHRQVRRANLSALLRETRSQLSGLGAGKAAS